MQELIIIWVLPILEEVTMEKAIMAYEKAIELNPEYAEAYNSLGIPILIEVTVEKGR